MKDGMCVVRNSDAIKQFAAELWNDAKNLFNSIKIFPQDKSCGFPTIDIGLENLDLLDKSLLVFFQNYKIYTRNNEGFIYFYKKGSSSYSQKLRIVVENDSAWVRDYPAKAMKKTVLNTKEENRKEDGIMDMNLKKMFVCEEVKTAGLCIMNSASVINQNGAFYSFTNGEVTEIPSEMILKLPAYLVSTPVDQVKAGDVIKTNGEYGFVKAVGENAELTVVGVTGTTSTINIPSNMLFPAMKMVPKIVFPFGNMMGTNIDNTNGMFGNPMMLMLLMNDGGGSMFGDGDMLKTMMLMNMMGNGGMFGQK